MNLFIIRKDKNNQQVSTIFDSWADYWNFAMGRMADDDVAPNSEELIADWEAQGGLPEEGGGYRQSDLEAKYDDFEGGVDEFEEIMEYRSVQFSGQRRDPCKDCPPEQGPLRQEGDGGNDFPRHDPPPLHAQQRWDLRQVPNHARQRR